MPNPKVLAFVLPQFHSIPENDEWWGNGFTEWTNVRKARPLFKGHYQPRVPQDERYYDLLDAETREWQASLARDHGISGFCYYHYWFNGKRLLEKPLERILSLRKPDFPFCLAWANEPWTRAWDGDERLVLMPQTYGDQADWEAHFQYLLTAFKDPRYIRVNDKPILLIYRTRSIAPFAEMVAYWRRRAAESDLAGLHLVSMLTCFDPDTRPNVCDAFAEFEPMCTLIRRPALPRIREQIINKWTRFLWDRFGSAPRTRNSLDYRALWEQVARKPLAEKHYPGAFVDWDNTPRKGMDGSLMLRNFTQDAFDRGFAKVFEKAKKAEAEFLFINAWNEWAEGTYLEPDSVRGTAFLDSISRTVNSHGTKQAIGR